MATELVNELAHEVITITNVCLSADFLSASDAPSKSLKLDEKHHEESTGPTKKQKALVPLHKKKLREVLNVFDSKADAW